MSFSGGGFSNYFATPDYQADVVSSYVDSLGSEYAGLYNKTGRGYPDVAAQGVNFQVSIVWMRVDHSLTALQVVIGGQTGGVSGTSASSPVSSSRRSISYCIINVHSHRPLPVLSVS